MQTIYAHQTGPDYPTASLLCSDPRAAADHYLAEIAEMVGYPVDDAEVRRLQAELWERQNRAREQRRGRTEVGRWPEDIHRHQKETDRAARGSGAAGPRAGREVNDRAGAAKHE